MNKIMFFLLLLTIALLFWDTELGLIVLMLEISTGLLVIACIDRKKLNDYQKSMLILTSVLFMFGTLLVPFLSL